MRKVLGRLVPASAKNSIRTFMRDAALRRAVARIRRLSAAEVARPEVLREFREAFGNEGFSGDVQFLAESAQRANRAEAPIVECGSGASTILVGHLLARRGIQLFSLEQDVEWCRIIRRDLKRLGLDNVALHHAPLCNHGDFDWYDVSSVQFPSRLAAALCDGPAFCRGWRAGLVPTLFQRGVHFDEILCDDADDPHAPAMFAFWQSEFGVTAEILGGSDGAMAVVLPKVRDEAPPLTQ